MKLPRSFVLGLATALALLAIDQSHAVDAPRKVLFFSKSSDFIHQAIAAKSANGKPGYAFPVLEQIGQQDSIEFTFSKDGTVFTSDGLAPYDTIVFYTTGDLTHATNPRKAAGPLFIGDGNPPLPAEGKQALIDAVKSGKGFIGIHSAADTFHTAPHDDSASPRFVSDGALADDYIKLLGGEFIQHGAQQVSRLTIVDRTFPGLSAFPASPAILEEWYSLKNFAPDLHVLIVNQTTGMKGIEYGRPDYPSTWIHQVGAGRVFYTSMGHREDVWNSPEFKAMLIGALNWTLKRVDADTTPNLKTAAPQAAVMPRPAPAKVVHP